MLPLALVLAMGAVGSGDIGNVNGLGVVNTSMVRRLGSPYLDSAASRTDRLQLPPSSHTCKNTAHHWSACLTLDNGLVVAFWFVLGRNWRVSYHFSLHLPFLGGLGMLVVLVLSSLLCRSKRIWAAKSPTYNKH